MQMKWVFFFISMVTMVTGVDSLHILYELYWPKKILTKYLFLLTHSFAYRIVMFHCNGEKGTWCENLSMASSDISYNNK